MVERLQAIRGMNDILPEQMTVWQRVEQIFDSTLKSYGYYEIRMPIVESTQLFQRSIGEVTDIVEKEMYTFSDLNGDSITLRPEGTAGCVRACLQHGLLHNQQQKLWYLGPMFRHERPQKGRYRQFFQLGVEAFGISGVGVEIELIALCQRLWMLLGFNDQVTLEINSLGTLEERNAYKAILQDYFRQHFKLLDEDSQRRLDKNPLRILDSKNPQMQELIKGAPKLLDAIGLLSQTHFEDLCAGLDTLNIKYTINPSLVRGLDYYSQTVFEWTTDKLGSQATICAGGRYDKLVEQLGGNATPAVGFALGVERIILLMETLNVEKRVDNNPSIFIIPANNEAVVQGLKLAEMIRNTHPELSIVVNIAGGSYKSQFKKADKSGARIALILGDEEVLNQQVSIKDLRVNRDQITLNQNKLTEVINEYLI